VLVTNMLDAVLYDSDGKRCRSSHRELGQIQRLTQSSMGAGKIMHPLYEGKNFSIASKEVELERTIPREQFISGLCFSQQSYEIDSTSSISRKNLLKKFNCPTSSSAPSLVGNTSRSSRSSGIQEGRLLEVTNQSEHWAANW